jgi:TIR domain
VTSAFVSYAHEDQEFVLALVDHLQAQGLNVRYDQIALHIGDSLIRAISREITEGDFLIAEASADEHLPQEVAQAKATNGRSVLVPCSPSTIRPPRFRSRPPVSV